MLRGGMRGWEEEGMEMEHDIRKKILMAKTGERPEYDTSPPPLSFPLCHRGGSQRADKQTADDKASGRFVARGTRPF